GSSLREQSLQVPTQPRVEGVAEAVADEVEGRDGEQDGEAGKERQPGLRADVLAPVADEHAPFGRGNLRAETDKGKTRGGEDRAAHIETGLHQQWRERIGQQ